MDSFILFNAKICPPTDDKILVSTQGKSINEKSIPQTLEIAKITDITDTRGKPHKLKIQICPLSKFLKLLIPAVIKKSYGT